MSVVFVITFGTSDVQFESKDIENSSFKLQSTKENGFESFSLTSTDQYNFSVGLRRNRNHDSFLLANPRKDGKTVLDNFETLSSIISLPLTLPAISMLIGEGNQINNFVLVFTDQHDAIEKHRSNDSVHVAAIFKKRVQSLFPYFTDNLFHGIPITEKVTDIDHQYKTLSRTCKSILQNSDDKIDRIILLAQGGIDQINQALTLQLIQAFGDKLIIYQQAEDQVPRPLHFTRLFLQDFIKKQVSALIDAADYHAAWMMLELINNETFNEIKNLVKFAEFRKLFLYMEAEKIALLYGKDKIDFLSAYCSKQPLPLNLSLEFSEHEYLFRIAERFFIADFYFCRSNYTDFVLALQIFYETLCILYLSDVYQLDLSRKYHESVTQLLDLVKLSHYSIAESASSMLHVEVRNLMVSFPTLGALSLATAETKSHVALQKILQHLLHINSQLNGYTGSCGLDILRNSIAHGGKGVLENDLYLASNVKNRKDRMNYWRTMMAELRIEFINNTNPYDEMNDFIVKRLSDLY